MSETVKAYFDHFKGIRRANSVAEPLNGVMSAVDIKNTELKYSGNSDAVGIYSMLGNIPLASLTNDEEVIYGMFESVQQVNDESVRYWFVYTSDGTKGRIYQFNKALLTFTLIYDVLTATTLCNGITVAQGLYDYFFFTNGIDAPITIQMSAEPANRVTVVNAVDYESRNIRGLGLESYDGRIVMTSGNRVHWSRQGDIFDWNTIASLSTDSAYQEFNQQVTAIVYYNNALITFTNDYSVAFVGNPAVSTSFTRSGASGNGCASFNSVLRFDNKLYYYDHKAKNIFSYYLYDTGQMRPSDGVANNIFDYFSKIDNTRIKEMQFFPILQGTRNEIWFKMPIKEGGNLILILNYTLGEWVIRDSQNINQIMLYNDEVFSCYENKIIKEYVGNLYEDAYRPSEYAFSVINLGSDATLKSCKGRISFTLDTIDEDGLEIDNDFFIEFIRDGNELRRKVKRISKKMPTNTLRWVVDEADLSGGYWVEDEEDLSGGVWLKISKYDQLFIISPIAPFKQLKIRIYTSEAGQRFAIKRIEFAKIKIKRAK